MHVFIDKDGEHKLRQTATFGGNVLADGSWVDFSRQACLDCQICIATQQQIEESSTMQVSDFTLLVQDFVNKTSSMYIMSCRKSRLTILRQKTTS
jgi:hypothetical protein